MQRLEKPLKSETYADLKASDTLPHMLRSIISLRKTLTRLKSRSSERPLNLLSMGSQKISGWPPSWCCSIILRQTGIKCPLHVQPRPSAPLSLLTIDRLVHVGQCREHPSPDFYANMRQRDRKSVV